MNENEYRKMFEAEDRYFWFKARNRLVRSLVEEAVAGTTGAVVVDVGCGTGGLAAAIDNLGVVIGIDANKTAMSYCKRRGLRRLARMNWSAPALKPSVADVVVCSDFIEHLDDDVKGVRDAALVLKTGGKIIVTVPAGNWLWSAHDVALGHRRRYDKRSLERALTTAGIRPARIFPFMGSLTPVLAPLRLGSKLLSKIAPSRERTETISYALPGFVNTAFGFVLDMEMKAIKSGRPMPFGTTLVALGIKD